MRPNQTRVIIILILFGFLLSGQGLQAQSQDFLAILNDQDPEMRIEAINSLDTSTAVEREITARLVELLADSNYNVQQAANGALVKIGEPAVPELEAGLAKFAGNNTITARQGIARILGQIDSPASVTVLIKMLNDPVSQIRRAAAQGLETIGPNAISASAALSQLVLDRDEDPQVRGAAAQALGKTGYDDDIAILALAIGRVETVFQVVWASQGSLDSLAIDTDLMISALMGMLDHDRIGFLAKDSLVHIINTTEDGLDTVKSIFKTGSLDQKLGIAGQLGALLVDVSERSDDLMALFQLCLDDPSSDVRLAACTSLVNLDVELVELVPRLAELALDKSEDLAIRRQAINAWEWLVNNDYGFESELVAIVFDQTEDRQIRNSALRMIGLLDANLPEIALELLANLEQLNEDDYWIISPYIFSVGRIESHVQAALIDMVIDSDNAAVKLFAIRVLSAIGQEVAAAIPVMMDIVFNSDDEMLRLGAVRAIVQMSSDTTDLADFFSELMDDNQLDVARIASQALGIYEAGEPPTVPAFPTAEGFGAWTRGGKGGRVYVVTNLNDSGPGSLRQGVTTSGPRIIVFAVGGVIELKSPLNISSPYITIAGQTAPGEGITLAHRDVRISTNDVIVQHIRMRLGDRYRSEADTLWINNARNVIVDHLSTSWGMDETLSVSGSDNITVQWSLITESMRESYHVKGAHGYGSLVRGEYGSKYSFLNNLWAHHMGRMPRPGNYTQHHLDPEGAFIDFRNNVFYNWGGSTSGDNYDTDTVTKYNFINNYYIMGPNSNAPLAFSEHSIYAQAYFGGNYMNDVEPADPWSIVDARSIRDIFESRYKQSQPFEAGLVSTQSAPDAYESILANGGALPRDTIDHRVIETVINRDGGHIDSPEEVGGLMPIFTHPAGKDSNNDGIPDWWWIKFGFDPTFDLPIHEDFDGDGYSNIEEYLNGTNPDVYQNYVQ